MSEISLDGLCAVVAQKLNVHPHNLVLHYYLSSDKVKDGATSIKSDEELQIFLSQLRKLIVLPCLPNGLPSLHPTKKIIVFFEDAPIGNSMLTNNNMGGTVRTELLICTLSNTYHYL